MPRRIFYGRYWYEKPPVYVGAAFALFVVVAIFQGCNQVLHRTPTQKGEIAQQVANWTFANCQAFQLYASNNGWQVTLHGGKMTAEGNLLRNYVGIKGDQQVKFTCDASNLYPAQNVCFTWTGSPECAARPKD